jgi:hypothetical protein
MSMATVILLLLLLLLVAFRRKSRAECFATPADFAMSKPIPSLRSALLAFQKSPHHALGIVRNRADGTYRSVSATSPRASFEGFQRFVTSDDVLLVTDLREARTRLLISHGSRALETPFLPGT